MRRRVQASLLAAVTLSAAGMISTASFAAPTGSQYATPEKAVDAFIGAVRKFNPKTLSSVFGKEAAPIFTTDDPVADEGERKRFLDLYDSQHQIVTTESGSMVLTVGSGNTDWPFPIPIVKTKKGWAFDTAAGRDEILNRRIGRSELQTIQTCLAIVAANYEYYSRDRDGDGILEYAHSIRSSPGLRDGLFWPAEPGEPQSPLGEIFAAASAEGYKASENSAYHGYRYKTLSSQGPGAADGAYEYLVRGNQIGGFAVVAYPASYGESGIMTFIVNHSGVIYQRDLGAKTDNEVEKMTRFDPAGWDRVPEKDLAPIPEE